MNTLEEIREQSAYSFICENGFYMLVRTNYRQVAAWGIGSKDRAKALKQARKHCRETGIKLNIEA